MIRALSKLKTFSASSIFDAGHASVLRLIYTGTNLVFGIMAARLVGEDAFGSYISVIAIAGLLSVITAGGIPALLQRELSSARGSGDFSLLTPLIQWIAVINIAFSVLIILCWTFFPEQIAFAFIFVVCSNFAAVLGAILNGFERVLLSQWIGSVVRPLGAVLALSALYFFIELNASLLILAQILGALIATFLFFALWVWPSLQTTRHALRSDWWSDQHKSVLKGGALISATQFLINIKTQIEIFLLTFFSTPVDVAYYYAASRAALVVAFFSTSTYLMAEPRLTRLMSARDEEALLAEVASTRRIAFIGTLLIGSFAALCTQFYLGLYGDGFESASIVMYILILSIVFRSMFGPALPILRASRQDYPALKVSILTLLAFTPISIVAINYYGILGAAVSSLLYSTANEFWLARAAQKKTGINTRVFF